MTTVILALLKSYWKQLAGMVLVLLGVWGFSHWRFTAGEDKANQVWALRWSQRDLLDSTAALHRDVAERAEEQRRQAAVNEEQKRADAELAKVQADVDAAKRAGNSLQHQLADIQAKYGRSETGRISALAAASAAKAEAARVLAKLLGESDKRAGIYAEAADGAFTAGGSCQRIYNKVTKQEK